MSDESSMPNCHSILQVTYTGSFSSSNIRLYTHRLLSLPALMIGNVENEKGQ